MIRRRWAAALLGAFVVGACAADPADTSNPAVTSVTPITSVATAEVTADSPPETSVPSTIPPITAAPVIPITFPDGVLSAVPYRYRIDWANGVFQVRLHNATDRTVLVLGVQFVWSGLTTPLAERHDTIVAGQTIDFPVAIVPAVCVGDGTLDDMPDLDSAMVRLIVDDGRELLVPVADLRGVAQTLYLDDCERQLIESEVGIEWVDLHDAVYEGRLVTEGGLRLVRRNSTSKVTLAAISDTILFVVEPIERVDPLEPIAVLDVGVDEVVVPIRITENRCDAHARSESSQSFRFFGQVDLGDGTLRPFEVLPSSADQALIRERFESGCETLADTGFVGLDG